MVARRTRRKNPPLDDVNLEEKYEFARELTAMKNENFSLNIENPGEKEE